MKSIFYFVATIALIVWLLPHMLGITLIAASLISGLTQ